MLVLWGILGAAGLGLLALYVRDRFFSTDAIIRNYPVVGHMRHLLIEAGPKLRQYIVADNREELPFNRDERGWIHRSADGENNYFGFGTDDQILGVGYPILKHAVFPYGEESFTASANDADHEIPAAVVLGEHRGRAKAWRPTSIVNISAMSYGSLGAHAMRALNEGAKRGRCYHNTGEGGISEHHRAFLEEGMADRTAWVASAKLGFPDRAIVAICLGADLINVARESMLAIGCIQAQKCHTGDCPAGVTTHKPSLQRGLIPAHQAQRFARYLKSFRNELHALTQACGYAHPSQFTAEDVEISTGPARFASLRELEGSTPARRTS